MNKKSIYLPSNLNRIIIKANNNLSFSLNIIKNILCNTKTMKKLFKKNFYPFKKFNFKYQIINNLNDLFEINYSFKIFPNKIPFILNCIFIKNKINNSTIVFLNFNIKNNFINIKLINTFYNILININKTFYQFFNRPLLNLSDHSSIIIKSSINEIWDFITKWNFIKLIYKENLYKIEFLGNSQNEKSIIKCFFIINKKKFVTEIYVNKCKKCNLIWYYFIEPISGNLFMQEIKFQFTKINENETFFSFDTFFKEKVSLDVIYKCKNVKQNFFDSIIKIFEYKNNNNKNFL